jgi:cellulose biosynthesis protein BcsQ
MNILNDLIASLLTSTVVSTLVSFVLKSWFENQLKHHFEIELEKVRHTYEIELEKLKAQLTVTTQTAHEITERRLNAYPLLGELIYRVRNLAREIVGSLETPHVLITEFSGRTNELEDNLYKFRIDLERDKVFIPIHMYKNVAKSFKRLLEDRDHYSNLGKTTEAENISKDLLDLYNEIEREHKTIIDNLSRIVPTDDRSNT